MREYTVINAPLDLLPQVVGELLSFAANPDLVDVVHGVNGREIHAHPEVAEAWFQARQQTPDPEPAPLPMPESAPAPVAEPAPAPQPVVTEPVVVAPAPVQVPQPTPVPVSRKK